MLLARDGHEVTVVEADPAPLPPVPADAWETWDRKGVAQFRQPHNLFARAREILDDDLPGMSQKLVEAGCPWVDPLDPLPPFITDRASRPDDERFRFVTGRRPVVEATFARAAEEMPGVSVRRGTAISGLIHSGRSNGIPHVEGVRIDGGEELRADLVVDAMGRRTKLPDWLASIGTG